MNPNPTGVASVALYSGGVDSYCMAVLTNPDVLLNVNLGGVYGAEETAHIKTPPGMEDRLECIDLPEIGSRFEMPDSAFILPARNAILALLGAQYGNTIMMGSVAAGGRGSDKDEGFEHRMTDLLQYIWQAQVWWNPDGRDTRLTRPVAHLTKRQVVAEAIKTGLVTGEQIRDDTFSCYTPTTNGEPCHQCEPCGRKWAALAANNIDPGYDGRPALSRYFNEIEQYWPEVPPGRTPDNTRDLIDARDSKW